MILINILLTFGYLFISRPIHLNINNINNNIKLCLYDNLNNLNNYKDSNGLKLYSAKDTTTTAIQWLYKTSTNSDTNYPTFVLIDLVNTINYSLKKNEKCDLYIAYVPDRFEEPHFMGSFLINPANRLLSIKQICTNPFIKETSLTEYKKKLINLSIGSGVILYTKPLKYLSNPRYYLEFNQY
jgi:hypothetical protein